MSCIKFERNSSGSIPSMVLQTIMILSGLGSPLTYQQHLYLPMYDFFNSLQNEIYFVDYQSNRWIWQNICFSSKIFIFSKIFPYL